MKTDTEFAESKISRPQSGAMAKSSIDVQNYHLNGMFSKSPQLTHRNYTKQVDFADDKDSKSISIIQVEPQIN